MFRFGSEERVRDCGVSLESAKIIPVSQEEQNSLIGQALVRYQQNKETLGRMEAKASGFAESLKGLAAILDPIATFEAPPKHNPSLVPEIPSHEEVFKLVCDIWDLRGTISSDRRSLEGMGVKFPIE